jgi:hypothetical protein
MWRWKCSQPWLRTFPPPHSYGNQRLQRQFDRLLMMGIVMPETCRAVSVQQGNKFYDWLLHLVGCFMRVITVELVICVGVWICGCGFCTPLDHFRATWSGFSTRYYGDFSLFILVTEIILSFRFSIF